MLLTSPVILQSHVLNWNNIGPKQVKGFISFLLVSNLSDMPHITVSNCGIFPSQGDDGHFWLNYQVVSGLSPACSLSCLHDCSLVSRLPCVICFPCSLCSLMSHPSVCSHNLSPALSASSSGTWITILIHLAVQDKCCLCSDGELSCSYFPKSRSWPVSCWKTFAADTSCMAELVMLDFLQLKVAFKHYFFLHVDYMC